VRILLLAAVTGVLAIIVSQAENCVRLNRGIRPILADDGFECHGPDKANCQADLWLDQSVSALAERDSRRAIDYGDLKNSGTSQTTRHGFRQAVETRSAGLSWSIVR